MKTIIYYDIQKTDKFKEDFSITLCQANTIIKVLEQRGLQLVFNSTEGKLYKQDFTELHYNYFRNAHHKQQKKEKAFAGTLVSCSIESIAAEVITYLLDNIMYTRVFIKNSGHEKDELCRQCAVECDLMLQILKKTNQVKASA